MNTLFAQRIFFAAILVQNYIQYKIHVPSTYYVQNTGLDDEEDIPSLERASVLCWQLWQKGRLWCYNSLSKRQVPSRWGIKYRKVSQRPWLVWLCGLSASLQTERLPVQFSVRACATQADRYFSPSLSPSPPLSQKIKS